MLGHKLFQVLRTRFSDVYCTLRCERKNSPLARLLLFQGKDVLWGVEARDWVGLEAILETYRPKVVINALGLIKQRSLAKQAIPCLEINALLPHRLSQTLSRWGGHLIHFSTDCVFSGRKGAYEESDPSDAEDLYGKTKFLGEVADADNVLTLRTSIIGRELLHHHSLLDWFLACNHGVVPGYQCVIYSGLTTVEMAEVITMIVRHYPTLRGLYHVASEPITKHDLLLLIKKTYGLKVRIESATNPVCDRSLNAKRFFDATGYVTPDWPALVRNLAADSTPYAQWGQFLATQ
jgi:dTDP-4-dehydrorhamnose reductase